MNELSTRAHPSVHTKCVPSVNAERQLWASGESVPSVAVVGVSLSVVVYAFSIPPAAVLQPLPFNCVLESLQRSHTLWRDNRVDLSLVTIDR